MIDFLAMIPAFVLGWIFVRLLAPLESRLEVPLGLGLGAGISSAIFFLLTWAGVASRISTIGAEAVFIAAGAALLFRLKRPRQERKTAAPPSWIWILRIAALIAFALVVMDFSRSLSANPDGGYDAAAIWNIRARYLAGGPQSWHYAVSPATGTNHPGYPLLVSAFVARTWTLLGDLRSSTPAALSAIFTLATNSTLVAALWTLAGEVFAWLAALLLLASEGFVSQASVQYADIPLSFFVLSSVAVLAIGAARDWPPSLVALAGVFASMAAWTKNEGLPFLAFVFVAVLWRGGLRSAKCFAAAAAPVLILTLAFKLFVAEGRESMFPATASQAFQMIAASSRWSEIFASFARNFWELGPPWAHPFLLMAILAWAFGFAPQARSRVWMLLAPAGLLAADFAVYLITMSGLTWHLSTSNNRVIIQVWPALIFSFLLMLRELPLAADNHGKRPSRSKTSK